MQKDDNSDEQIKAIEPVPCEMTTGTAGSYIAKYVNSMGITLNKTQFNVIQNFMERAQHGHSAVLPMRCKGEDCKFISMCPLKQAKVTLPEGLYCPVERGMIDIWVNKTIESLDIDPNDSESAVDMDMAYELASIELIRTRAAHHLHENPELVQVQIVGYSPTNQPIYDEKPSQSLLILERHSKIVNKIREALLATRKSQAQAGHIAGDTSTRTANLAKKARERAEENRKKYRELRKLDNAEEVEFAEIPQDDEQENNED